MLVSEHQNNTRASRLAIEEVYTDADVNRNVEYDGSMGYSFDYPYKWLDDQSQFKMVSPRRLEIIPTNHIFYIGVKVWKRDDVGNEVYIGDKSDRQLDTITIPPIMLNITEKNGLEEVIHHITTSLSRTSEAQYGSFTMSYHYDYKTGSLSFDIANKHDIPLEFIFTGPPPWDSKEYSKNMRHFLKFLNQPVLPMEDIEQDDGIFVLTGKSFKKSFTNVWNRKRMQFHASFSDARRGYIGQNHDRWEKPSKMFKSPSNSSCFNIRFTTDGVHNILPIHCGFVIELCFIINYKNSVAMR